METRATDPTWQPRLAGERPGYRELVRAIEADIRAGRLLPGTQLPTHRELAASIGVARGTVARAYDEAQRLGLVRSGVGQGTFVSHAHDVRARQLEPADVIDFGMAYPIYELDPDLGPVLAELARHPDRASLLRYPAPGGPPAQRRAGARWCAHLGLEVAADDLLVTAGAQHAIHTWLLSVVRPGGGLLTGELTYRMTVAAAESLGIEVHGVAMDADGLLPDALDELARSTGARGLYTMPNIQNPTTAVQPEARRRELIEVARKRGLQVLEDDIHGPFLESPPPPLKALCPERVTYVASLSKSVAGGLRIAYAAPPADRLPAFSSALHTSIWSPPLLPAEIASRWIEDGTAMAVVEAKRRDARERLERVHRRLEPLVAELRSAAYFAWVRLPTGVAAATLTMEAQRRRVSVMPAEAFFVGDGPAPEAVRLSVGVASREQLERGLDVLEALLSEPGGWRTPVV